MKNNQSGIIILVTLWIMAILTIFALGIGYRTSLELRLARYQIDKLKTLYLAKAALQQAKQYLAVDLNNDTQNYDSIYRCGIYLSADETPEKLFKDIPLGDGRYSIKYKIGTDEFGQSVYRYGLSDEERRININYAPAAALKNLFELLGIEPAKGDTISASIVDWRDADLTPLNPYGAENEYYQNLDQPYNCKNSNFETLEELLLVKDVTTDIFNKIKDYLTVYGDASKVNINTASAVVLQSLYLGFANTTIAPNAPDFANKIVDYRSGDDKIDGTADDKPCIPSPSVSIPSYLVQILGSMLIPNQTVSNLTAKSVNFRAEIQAVSSDNKVVKNIVVILESNGNIKFWQEE